MLNETDLKEKRKQKLMKAGYDARIRMKAEKDEERRRIEEETARDELLRVEDFGAWVRGVRREHQVRLQGPLPLPLPALLDAPRKRLTDLTLALLFPSPTHTFDLSGRSRAHPLPQETQGATLGPQVARRSEPHEVHRRSRRRPDEGGWRGSGWKEAEACWRGGRRFRAERCGLGGLSRDCAPFPSSPLVLW